MSEEIQRTTYMYSKMQQYYKGGMCFKMVLPCANTNNSWSNLLIYAFFTLINIPLVHVYIHLVLFQIPLCENFGGKLFPLL